MWNIFKKKEIKEIKEIKEDMIDYEIHNFIRNNYEPRILNRNGLPIISTNINKDFNGIHSYEVYETTFEMCIEEIKSFIGTTKENHTYYFRVKNLIIDDHHCYISFQYYDYNNKNKK